MGQAKQRGNYEERRQQAIDRRKEEMRLAMEAQAERQRKAQEAWDALTPEQQEQEREKYRRRRANRGAIAPLLMTALMGASMGIHRPNHR